MRMLSCFAIKHPSSKGERAPETDSRLAGLTVSLCCVAAGDGGLGPTDNCLWHHLDLVWHLLRLAPPSPGTARGAGGAAWVVVVEREDRSTSGHELAPSGT